MVDTDRITGAAKEFGGKVQGAVGDAAGSNRDSAEGRAREVRGKAENVYGQAKDTVRGAVENASDYADDFYENGGRYLRDGTGAVGQQVGENPLVALLIAGALGYGLGFLIHGQR